MSNIIISTENLEVALKKNGMVRIPNFGTFTIKPRRKGGVGFEHGSKNVLYEKRITFKPSKVLKDNICK